MHKIARGATLYGRDLQVDYPNEFRECLSLRIQDCFRGAIARLPPSRTVFAVFRSSVRN